MQAATTDTNRPYQRKTIISILAAHDSTSQFIGADRDPETAGRPTTQKITFDVGKAALDLHTSLQAAPHWQEDLMWLCAPSGVALALLAIALGGYSVASINTGLSTVVVLQTLMVPLAAAWFLSTFTMWRTAIRWTLYATITALIFVVVLFVLWLTAYRYVLNREAWLWWALLGVFGLQLMLVFGTCIALASLYSLQLVFDKEYTRKRAMSTSVKDRLRRRGHRGDGRSEARIEPGALALAELAADVGKTVPSGQKKDA